MPTLSETPRDLPTRRGTLACSADALGGPNRSRNLRSFHSPACRRASGWILLAFVIGIALTGDLRAQFLEPDQSFKSKRTDVVKILREDKAIPPADQQMFDDFFRLYAIPQFAAKEHLNNLPRIRGLTRTNYFMQPPGASGPPHQRANTVALEKFREILRIKTPPGASTEVIGQLGAVKVNVVLAIGEMNEQEAGTNQKAKPLPQALTALLAYFNAKPPESKAALGTSDALRFAALVGIRRHAESDSLTPEARGLIQQNMLAMLQQKQPPEGREVATQNALRRRAAATLGVLHDVGNNGAVVKALDSVLGNPSEPAKVRAEVAASLGKLKAAPDAKIDFKSLANHIGWLMIDVGRPEAVAAGEKETPAAWRLFRATLRDGLEGIVLATTVIEANQRQFVDAVNVKIKTLERTMENPKKLDNIALAKSVNDQLKELEAVLEPRAVAAPKGPDTRPAAPDARPVAPDTRPKKPGEKSSAVVNKPPKSSPARRRPVEQVSVDKCETGGKSGSEKDSQNIEPAEDEVEKTAAP